MNIENYFESDGFLEALKPLRNTFEKGDVNFNSNLIEYLISISIKYSILFRRENKLSTVGLDNFVGKIATELARMDLSSTTGLELELKKYVSRLCVDELLEKANLTRSALNNENSLRGLCSYALQNLMGGEYKFHAFNSIAYDSIRENGINPNVRFTSQEQINFINDIFERYNIKMIFGWQKLNCEDTVSYSTKPSVTYYYGVNSPEWFAQFTGQSFRFNPSGKYKKGAFVEGDYDAARNNLLTLMGEKQFSLEDISEVLKFFESNWEIYANKNPMVAIIPGENTKETTEYWTEHLLNSDRFKDDIEKILDFCLSFGEVDCQTKETIDTTNAIFVKLPRYNELVKRVTLQQEHILEEKSSEEILYDKMVLLAQARIKVGIRESGETFWVSEHGEEEVTRVKEILEDDEVYRAIVTNRFGEELSLDGWISSFSSRVINQPENVKFLALNKPESFGIVSSENRNNVELMRECASQQGIKPMLTCYVGKDVQNDFEFISDLIVNSSEDTFDFYGSSEETLDGSNMRYGKSIGFDVRSNPQFWQALNSKIMSINENSSRNIPIFSEEQELNLVIVDKMLEEFSIKTNPQDSHYKPY